MNQISEEYTDAEFYKVVEGQGYDDTYFTTDGVKSRFMDPDDPSKSEWRPNSVPDVRAQPWKNSYRDGACGLRQKDEDYGLNDPEIPTRELQDRGNCSNIEDNPLHPTMPDELVKELYVVERRRAKFVAGKTKDRAAALKELRKAKETLGNKSSSSNSKKNN